MKYTLSGLFFFLVLGYPSFSQTRYVDEVFSEDEIVVVKDVFYSRNISTFHPDSFPDIYTAPLYHVETDLHLDIYMPDPSIDDQEERPVVIIPHGGLYPPYYLNCWGSKEDLATTDLAYRLAKMGYVAIAPELRYGFDLTVSSNLEFIEQVMRFSVGRSIDLKNCARFLRHNHAELGNLYNIHPDQFVLWGTNNQFTLPYTTFYTDESEFFTPFYYLFNFETLEFQDAYDATYFGGFEGLNDGYLDSTLTNIKSEYPSYSGQFQMSVNHGVEVFDSLFLQQNETPSIYFISKNSLVGALEFYPAIGAEDEYLASVFTPTWQAKKMDELGNMDLWKDIAFANPIANERLLYPPDTTVGKIEGLYGLEGRSYILRPWIYWDNDTCMAVNEQIAIYDLETNIGMTITNGRGILDTMIQYFAPRACVAMGIECPGIFATSSTQNRVPPISFTVKPNPTSGHLNVSTEWNNPIQQIELTNLNGQVLLALPDLFTIHQDLAIKAVSGMYIIKVFTAQGIGMQKIIVR